MDNHCDGATDEYRRPGPQHGGAAYSEVQQREKVSAFSQTRRRSTGVMTCSAAIGTRNDSPGLTTDEFYTWRDEQVDEETT